MLNEEVDKDRMMRVHCDGKLEMALLHDMNKPLFSMQTTEAPMRHSVNGDVTTFVDESGVGIVSLGEKEANLARHIKINGIRYAWPSPLGTYFCSLERVDKATRGSAKNLKIWRTADFSLIKSFNVPNYTITRWEVVKWSADEKFMAVLVGGRELLFFETRSFTVEKKLIRRNIAAFSFNSRDGAETRIAIGISHDSKKPGCCELLSFPELEVILTKSFYGADEIDIEWNSQGNAILARVFTEVDESGRSYYGKSRLAYLSQISGASCFVPLEKEGQIHEYSWTPRGNRFVVICGSGSPVAIMFNMECRPIYNFGSRKFNSLSWSPHGRYFCLYATSSIGGQNCEIWEAKSKDQFQLISRAANVGNIHSLAWSPRGDRFVTGTLTPNLRVDNGFKLWNIKGEMLLHKEYDVLRMVDYKPAKEGAFPDPGPSNMKPVMGTLVSDQAAIEIEKQSKQTRYVPPHLRNKDKSSSDEVKVDGDFLPHRITHGSGASIDSQTDDVPGQGSGVRGGARRNKKKKNQVKEKDQEKNVQEEVIMTVDDDVSVASKIRSLKKKLRQIEKLKESRNNGVVLNQDQSKKLKTERLVLAELQMLEQN